MKKAIFILSGALLFFISMTDLSAQKGDTLAPYRDFMRLSNAYKTMPLYLEAGIRKADSFESGAEDTSSTSAIFFLNNENAYLRAGAFEQVVSDSMALLIDNNFRHMVLYTGASPVIQKMRAVMNITVFPDSSLQYIAGRYKGRVLPASDSDNRIELESRMTIAGTHLPNEQIEMRYDAKKNEPRMVRTVKRMLQPVDDAGYQIMKADSNYSGRLIQANGGYFLIREQVVEYVFEKIDHSGDNKVPLVIHDRVVKNEEGEFVPAKEYAHYKLTVNN